MGYFVRMERVVQFAGPRAVEVAEYPPEPLPPGHVRVRTRYSGISAGTELTAYRGTNPYLARTWDPASRLFSDGAGEVEYPVTGWGYSEVGEVLEVAGDVAGAPGTPVAGDPVWGIWGHRSEGIVPAERLVGHVLPAGLDPAAGAFARVGAIALNAVLAADLHLGETVAVFGQGVLGLLVTRLATLSGAEVVAVDALPARLGRAAGYGAVEGLAPAGAAERIRERAGGAGADGAIEISGAYPAPHAAIRSGAVG